MANEFQNQFNEALREAEFADLKKHADEISTSVSEIGQIDPIGDVQKDVEHAFADTPALDAPVEPAADAAVEGVATPTAVTDASPPLPAIEPPPEPSAAAHEDAAAAPAPKAGGGA
jgi:sec-independent protein translocase protein TatB